EDLVEDASDLEDEALDDPAAVQSNSSEVLACNQSIAFSPTYQVPVFYFTVHDSRGSPLTLEHILKTTLLHRHALSETQASSFALVQPEAPFPLLSQGDHPTMGTPSWYIHPCGTASAMGELIGEKNAEGLPDVSQSSSPWVDWLETWFMVLGNIVELGSV
ncbi:hypothetical protein BC834DRAFT_820430, partial [Gloeopeniophorella convolvens]